MSKKHKMKDKDDLDKWLDKEFPSRHLNPSDKSFYRRGRHGKKVNGHFLGIALADAYEMGAMRDDDIEDIED